MSVVLLLANMVANTFAQVCFKLSANGKFRSLVVFQLAGNIAGFIGVLAYTALLREMSLHAAFPLTQGLTAVGVQVVGSALFLRERLGARSWLGTSLIIAGVVLLGI